MSGRAKMIVAAIAVLFVLCSGGVRAVAVLLAVVILAAVVFGSTHLSPLDAAEMIQLATKRRSTAVRKYMTFPQSAVAIDGGFKSRMRPDGKFYMVDIELSEFPSVAAALLKYKKHEWYILGFESGRRVFALWANKGADSTQVELRLPIADLPQALGSRECTCILGLHNHPNPSPAHYNCTNPSPQDWQHADDASQVLGDVGISFAAFVCERGRHYMYHLSVSDTLLPVGAFASTVEAANNRSRLRNLCLHAERVLR